MLPVLINGRREGKGERSIFVSSSLFSENAVPPEVERDAHITQSYWMEIRHVVRCIYRDDMDLSGVNLGLLLLSVVE